MLAKSHYCIKGWPLGAYARRRTVDGGVAACGSMVMDGILVLDLPPLGQSLIWVLLPPMFRRHFPVSPNPEWTCAELKLSGATLAQSLGLKTLFSDDDCFTWLSSDTVTMTCSPEGFIPEVTKTLPTKQYQNWARAFPGHSRNNAYVGLDWLWIWDGKEGRPQTVREC